MQCDNVGVYLEESIVRAAFEYSIRENVSLSGFLGDECVTMRHTPEIQVDCHCEAPLHAVFHLTAQSFIRSFFLPCLLPSIPLFVPSFHCSYFHPLRNCDLLLLQPFVPCSVGLFVCLFTCLFVHLRTDECMMQENMALNQQRFLLQCMMCCISVPLQCLCVCAMCSFALFFDVCRTGDKQ